MVVTSAPCLQSNNFRFSEQHLDSGIYGVRGCGGCATGLRTQRRRRRASSAYAINTGILVTNFLQVRGLAYVLRAFLFARILAVPVSEPEPSLAGLGPARDGGYLLQNFHHGLERPSARAFAPNSWCSWLICWSLAVTCVTRSPIRASSALIKALLLLWSSSASWLLWLGLCPLVSISMRQRNPCGVFSCFPGNCPLRTRLRTVSSDMPRWSAASLIDTVSMFSLLIGLGISLGQHLVGYLGPAHADFRAFGCGTREAS